MSGETKMTQGGIAFGPPGRGPQHVEIAQALEIDVKRWRVRAEELEAILRDALSKQGPRAHLPYCPASFAVPGDCDCWIGRARRLLGMEER